MHVLLLSYWTHFHQADSIHFQDEDAYFPAAGLAEDRELADLFEKINLPALVARASHLRKGTPCSTPGPTHCRDKATRSSVMGGMNYHIELAFDDGVKWIARVRRLNASSPPPALRNYILQSEAATLKFLARTSVPAPRVFDFALEDDPSNLVGVGYILMEKLPGKSLQWHDATADQKQKVMDKLSDTFIELRKHPLNLLGSLDRPDDPEAGHVGPFARESLTSFTQAGEMRTIGPLSSWDDYYTSSLRIILDLILHEEMYSEQAVDAYLIHRYLLDLLPSILTPPGASKQGSQEEYFLKHADDKGDHILVDDDFNITGIIDWEWAYTAPLAQAFNSPIGLLPVADFYDGASGLGEDEMFFARLLEEKGHQDLAGCVRRGRLQHRFEFCCGYNLDDWSGFLGLFQGLRKFSKTEEDRSIAWIDWKAVALHRYREDAGLQTLLSKH